MAKWKECRFCEIEVTNSTVDQLCSSEIPVSNSSINTYYPYAKSLPNGDILILSHC